MPQLNDLSRSLVILEQDATLIAVIEMGQSSWLVAGIVPGVERSPLKKLAVDESALLKLLNRWREEAEKAGHRVERIAIALGNVLVLKCKCCANSTSRTGCCDSFFNINKG